MSGSNDEIVRAAARPDGGFIVTQDQIAGAVRFEGLPGGVAHVDVAAFEDQVRSGETIDLPVHPVHVLQQAFHVMRSGRPGPVLVDLPVDVQMGEIAFDPLLYAPLPVHRPVATRAQIERAMAMLAAAKRPLIVAGGGTGRLREAFVLAREWAKRDRVPVVVEVMLERVTNVAMGAEIDRVVEFEDVLDLGADERAVPALEA